MTPATRIPSAEPFPWGTILEVGHRAKAWPAVFYGLSRRRHSPPPRASCSLSQALDHATFLYTYHAGGSNWIITEMTGLLSLAAAWPEFRQASAWRELALTLIPQEMQRQVYPDGVQKELSSNYQLAVLWHIDHYLETMRGARFPEDPEFIATLERMWNYLAYSLCPNGQTPQNGDSDRPESGDSQVVQPLEACQPVLAAAREYRREDWRYIATNGAKGACPPGLPSILFPWGGQLIMRSGWEADAHWGYFDIGPWGYCTSTTMRCTSPSPPAGATCWWTVGAIPIKIILASRAPGAAISLAPVRTT